jgi:hypothetical protein
LERRLNSDQDKLIFDLGIRLRDAALITLALDMAAIAPALISLSEQSIRSFNPELFVVFPLLFFHLIALVLADRFDSRPPRDSSIRTGLRTLTSLYLAILLLATNGETVVDLISSSGAFR